MSSHQSYEMSKLKVTLFGATGKTGRHLIAESLKRGIDITVFARPSSSFENFDVRVVRGDLTDRSRLEEAIRGADAVLSALGPTKLSHPRDLPITRATNAIISAMKEVGVKRLIAVSTGTAVDPGDGRDWKIWLPALLVRYAMPSVYADIIGTAATMRASKLNWTMVRVALLTDGPATKRLNVGLYGHAPHNFAISREDAAKFMLDRATKHDFVREAPGISG